MKPKHLKITGWITSAVGALMAIINTSQYVSKQSTGMFRWRYQAEIESAQTFLFVGLVILAIGIAILFYCYKNNKKEKE